MQTPFKNDEQFGKFWRPVDERGCGDTFKSGNEACSVLIQFNPHVEFHLTAWSNTPWQRQNSLS